MTSGRPFVEIDVRVVDEEGGDITPGSGEVGEIVIRGPTGEWADDLPQLPV